MPRPPAAAARRSPSETALEPSRRNRFAGLTLDRSDERRGDSAWLAEAWRRGRLIVLDADGQAATDPNRQRLHWLACEALDPELLSEASLLGCQDCQDERQPWFALAVEQLAAPLRAELRDWLGLRQAAASWGAFDSGLFCYAKALLHWQRRNRYCGACGAELQTIRSGHARRCSALNCSLSVGEIVDNASNV